MMLKKLSIFAVAGLSVFLSGCSLTSISDEQYVQQTVALNQMQQQMTSLLSGMDALREQNQQLS
jgi:outer membrane murein-binding lipoprotein Lpp